MQRGMKGSSLLRRHASLGAKAGGAPKEEAKRALISSHFREKPASFSRLWLRKTEKNSAAKREP